MSHLNWSDSTDRLRASILDDSVIAVSDGSYYQLYEVGVCAWLIATPDGTEWIEGGRIVAGVPQEHNSYRSELVGQLGIATFFDALILPVSSCHIFTVYDGLAALNTVGTGPE